MRHGLVALSLVVLAMPLAAAQTPPGYAIASAHPLATEAGVEVLRAGGNAFDAAVAVAAVLGVVEPSGSGLGGGGFFLLHEAATGLNHFLDAREVAPLAATADMYLDKDGQVRATDLRSGPLAAGIPGVPAALDYLSQKHGKLELDELLKAAIRHAREGFEIDEKLARYIGWREQDLAAWPASARVFLPQGRPLKAGERLIQADLAATLERIAVFGAAGFYGGSVADKLIASVRAAGGIWGRADLDAYTLKTRAPLILDYQGWQVVTAPPPSSGGLVLGLMFNILNGFDPRGLDEVDRLHLRIEAMRRAYYDRSRVMGDSDFVDVPVRGLLSAAYAEAWQDGIDLRRATPSQHFGAPPAEAGGGENTTHFSIIDAEGNRVSATLSINFMLGSAFIAEGTGVLLNNEMDDFVAKPGEPNAYGLVGGRANAIEPGKRMLSSMTPTFIENAGRVAILGTPGGSRIISMVFHAIEQAMVGASAAELVAAPRYHHQYLPDVVQFEPEALSAAVQAGLRARGHVLEPMTRSYGNFQAVIWDRAAGRLDAAADPRGVGQATVGQLPVPSPVPEALPQLSPVD